MKRHLARVHSAHRVRARAMASAEEPRAPVSEAEAVGESPLFPRSTWPVRLAVVLIVCVCVGLLIWATPIVHPTTLTWVSLTLAVMGGVLASVALYVRVAPRRRRSSPKRAADIDAPRPPILVGWLLRGAMALLILALLAVLIWVTPITHPTVTTWTTLVLALMGIVLLGAAMHRPAEVQRHGGVIIDETLEHQKDAIYHSMWLTFLYMALLGMFLTIEWIFDLVPTLRPLSDTLVLITVLVESVANVLRYLASHSTATPYFPHLKLLISVVLISMGLTALRAALRLIWVWLCDTSLAMGLPDDSPHCTSLRAIENSYLVLDLFMFVLDVYTIWHAMRYMTALEAYERVDKTRQVVDDVAAWQAVTEGRGDVGTEPAGVGLATQRLGQKEERWALAAAIAADGVSSDTGPRKRRAHAEYATGDPETADAPIEAWGRSQGAPASVSALWSATTPRVAAVVGLRRQPRPVDTVPPPPSPPPPPDVTNGDDMPDATVVAQTSEAASPRDAGSPTQLSTKYNYGR